MASISDYALWITQWLCISGGGVPQWSVRKWLCHQGRWGTILGSGPWGNFVLAAEMWLPHCTVQKVCSHTWRSLDCQKWTWCTVVMIHPSWFARTKTLGLSMKNDQHLPNSPALLGSSAVGRSLSSCGHWDGGSLYKSTGFHPPFEPTTPLYTMHSGWGRLLLNPTSLSQKRLGRICQFWWPGFQPTQI